MNAAAVAWRRAAALAIMLLAFGLRVAGLGHQELRGDEAFGYFFAQRDYGEMLDATVELQEPHPVASYFVQRAWLGAAGDTEYALRFPSAWFSVLAVALLLRLAVRLGFCRGPSLLATFLLAISPYVIWHAQDARMYSMSLALTVATVWLGIETMQRQRVGWGLAYSVATWLALHTHYYAVFVLLALNLFVFTRAIFVPRTRANFIPWMQWQLLIGALYLPWLAGASTILGSYGGNGDSPAFATMIERSLAAFAVGESMPIELRLLWASVAVLLLLLGGLRLLLGTAADRRNLWLLALYLAVPVLATWYSAQSRPIFNERYLVAAVPPFYLLIAAGLDRRRFSRRTEWVLKTGAGVGVALLGIGVLFSLSQHYTNAAFSKTRGWRELAAALTQLSLGVPASQVRIAQNFPDPTLWYYYRGAVEHVVLPPTAHDSSGAAQAVTQLTDAGVRRVILPIQPAANWDHGGIAATALAAQYDKVHTEQVGVWPLHVFAGWPDRTIDKPIAVKFENGIVLRGASDLEASLPPVGLLTPTLYWEIAPASALETIKVTVQLLNSSGQLVTQQDLPLAAAHAPGSGVWVRTYGLSLPEELAPGAYRLIAGLYDSAAEGTPRVLTTTGADAVELAVIEIGG